MNSLSTQCHANFTVTEFQFRACWSTIFFSHRVVHPLP